MAPYYKTDIIEKLLTKQTKVLYRAPGYHAA